MNRHKKRGFTIIEILVVISLIGVFLLALEKIQASELRQSKLAAAHDGAAARVDAAVRKLRADMWEAESASTRDDKTLWIGRSIGESNEKNHTVTWKILDAQHLMLRRTTQFWRGDAQAINPPILETETNEDFFLDTPIFFEMATEKFVNPVAWSSLGNDPMPQAIRLHLGSDNIYLPNQGVFTIGFRITYPAEAKGAAQ